MLHETLKQNIHLFFVNNIVYHFQYVA